MAFRKDITIQLGLVVGFVDINSAIVTTKGLTNVCEGLVGHEHVATALKQSKLKCPTCETEEGEYTKKAEVVGKAFRVVTQDEIDAAKEGTVGTTKSLINLQAHPIAEVELQTIQNGAVYQLKANNADMVPVVSQMVDTIRRHPELMFTCLWSPSGKQNFYSVRVFGDTLIMEQRCRTEDLKIEQQPLSEIDVVAQAKADLILSVSVTPYDLSTYSDLYIQRIKALLDTKESVVGVVTEKVMVVAPGSVDVSAMLDAGLVAAGLKVA